MIDWDDAFDNSGYVPAADRLAERWAAEATASRDKFTNSGQAQLDLVYLEHERCRLDLFVPPRPSNGLIMFVHGGYWHKLDKTYWSQLADAALAAGWAFAIPSYPLAPAARIKQITRAVCNALEYAAARVDGPIRLIGHSAGGHLVARLACSDIGWPAEMLARIEKVLPVSGVFDLRPLLQTQMNQILGLDAAEAEVESPVLLEAHDGIELCCWVGAAERPEFLRQTRLFCETWQAAGAQISDRYESGKNHFSVIEGLTDAESPLFKELIA